ncbi:hypothetical protein DDB_G0276971 [Dictyostelium discoideum AX4]|uniref:Uncharacterized protein n=1 Tax=Dictyostelium discoideum TaxID=44689 RepID=Q550F5_DICDI|nr:hypothetical protein DDB_G0276971 [Dictyostelium discoideum AX4]EAL68987.1 hypothetical protein DDB_G0276971 [Dictyostelium discoideum AX4]|eukprot:XP_642977.1 hypothetical protein DDB_G0276971 [Dictyostelium discoideum AX4]
MFAIRFFNICTLEFYFYFFFFFFFFQLNKNRAFSLKQLFQK